MTILYFAWLRDRIGLSDEQVEVPDHVKTVADLTDWLASRGDKSQQSALRSRLRARLAGCGKLRVPKPRACGRGFVEFVAVRFEPSRERLLPGRPR